MAGGKAIHDAYLKRKWDNHAILEQVKKKAAEKAVKAVERVSVLDIVRSLKTKDMSYYRQLAIITKLSVGEIEQI